MIKVNGQLTPQGQWFHINLQLGFGDHEAADAALHFNPRFDESRIVRNSYLNRDWGHEESNGGWPNLQSGYPFEIIILATMNEYRVAINGQHYCTYAHRVGMDRVNHLNIGKPGEVTVSCITITTPPGPAPHQPGSW